MIGTLQHHRLPRPSPGWPAHGRPPSCRAGRRLGRGFTLIELLVIMAIISLIAGMSYVGFQQMMLRARLVSDATNISNALQRARGEAIRRGNPLVVEIDTVNLELVFYLDRDGDLTLDPLKGDLEVLPRHTLAQAPRDEATVYFWTQGDPIRDPNLAMVGFTGNFIRPDGTAGVKNPPVLVFETDGGVRDEGSIRIGMGPLAEPAQQNFMEVAVVTRATGRTELRKYVPSAMSYQPKIQVAGGGTNWKFQQ